MQQITGVDVVVIGAGAAGLTAARVLHNAGKNVVTVEARDRIGGRVHTVRDWGCAIDIGASWIHGTMGNPVTHLRDRAHVGTVVTDIESIALYAHASGRRVDAGMQAHIAHAARAVIGEIERPTPPRVRRESMEKLVAEATERAHLDSETELAGLRFHLWEHFENEWGASPAQLSAKWYKDTKYEGEQEVFPDGYDEVLEFVRTDRPPHTELRVERDYVVDAITYDRDGVKVEANGKPSFEARWAIVTLPLGVLQATSGPGTVKFKPQLPRAKRDAIARLQMGTLSKTWLLFDDVYWPRDVQIIACLRPETRRWSSWYAFQEVTNKPVLLGLNGGDVGKDIEKLENAKQSALILEESVAVLRKCLGVVVRQPELLQSNWTNDDFSRGSYSYVPAGASPDDRATLGDPVLGRLLFAGEATHTTCSQTVHGAILSGYREARRILSAF